MIGHPILSVEEVGFGDEELADSKEHFKRPQIVSGRVEGLAAVCRFISESSQNHLRFIPVSSEICLRFSLRAVAPQPCHCYCHCYCHCLLHSFHSIAAIHEFLLVFACFCLTTALACLRLPQIQSSSFVIRGEDHRSSKAIRSKPVQSLIS